jgi:alpha-amylase/alpha-mannosidase (GH57 family)
MTRVAILWHMHQPFYEDLVTGEHILPWVRLHALKDYFGMVALLREFPDVRATFNLVPSLLVQLDAFAQDRARDRHLELGLKPAEALTPADVDFIVEHFFHAHRQRMIDRYPRYAELFAHRQQRPFGVDDLRDLQVLHKLAWIDPLYLDGDARVRALVEKERGFSEADKMALRAIELEILSRVVPEYRAAAERGQIEISASPFYHPILPLLCDTDVYLRTHPDARRPRQRFAHPEDAAEQLRRAADCHERLFGRAPIGLWPSEGSVSDAMVPLAAGAGFTWMATDELILARTLGATFSRDGQGHLEQPERLYAPYRVRAGGAAIACAFRDHALSDLIGFTYAGWPTDQAADDFVGRLVEAGRRFERRGGGEDALIPIILDGENAWEHFEGGGRPFLRALYERLGQHAELRTVTLAEGCANATKELPGIFPGSWIDANFYIWIGHADDQRAWSQLAEARSALDTAGSAADLASACEEILIAEGSDWCWWYGDDHSSAHDLEFDDLYRRHLRNAYRFMGRPAPDELYVSNISTGGAPPPQTAPTGLLAPTLDGEDTSYFEWLGAGTFEVPTAAGVMHRIGRPSSAIRMVRFGFDRTHFYVRVDGVEPMIDLLGQGREVRLQFLAPAGVRFVVRSEAGRLSGAFWRRDETAETLPPAAPDGVDAGAQGAAVAAGQILELALPLAALGARDGSMLSFFVAVAEAGRETERQPAHGPIEAEVPDGLFAARHWRA